MKYSTIKEFQKTFLKHIHLKLSSLKIITLLLLFSLQLKAQHSNPDTLLSTFSNEEIILDGQFNEQAWKTALIISNFTQQELNEGEPSTERTEVSIVHNQHALFIGIRCFDSDPDKITGRFLQRDFDWGQDDNFEIIISPFNDKRNGYLFAINPNGARADAQVTNEGEFFNLDWNGVWDAVAVITKDGWFAEIYIPFSTLQYPEKEEQVWGINFERNIRRKNEKALWQGWSRNYELETISQAGTLNGLKNINGQIGWEIKPYSLCGIRTSPIQKPGYTGKIGLDINKNLLSTLKLNLTINTDFAQVEADRIQVNLSRFSIYYPEKRDFFLEGAGNYDFGLGNGSKIFYSRTIGISNFALLPVLGGVRVFGKANHTNIGFLSLQTVTTDSIPSTNYSVIRIRQDIGSRSSIGFIATSNFNGNHYNQAFGCDGKYSTSTFLKDKNLIVGGEISATNTKGINNNNNLSWRLYADYPNDLIDMFIGGSSIGNNYNPEMGFLRRSNYTEFYHHFAFTPRWLTKYGVKKMNFKFYEVDCYWSQTTGKLESYNTEFRPLGAYLKSGEWFEANLQFNYDNPPNPFNLSDSIVIPSGKYKMTNYELQFGTFDGRKLYTELFYRWGGFYTGQRQTFAMQTGLNFNKHINFSAEYTYNKVNLTDGSLSTNEVATIIRYSFNTKLNVSVLSQWNSEEDLIGFNFRLHWIPKIGSDFYFVINQNYHQTISYERMEQTNVAAKLVWRFVF